MGIETALIAAAGVAAAGSLMDAGAESAASKRQAAAVKEQIKAEKVQKARDLADLERQRGASDAALRAMMAATGMTGTASATSLAEANSGAFGRSKARVLQDYEIRGGVLQARKNELNTQANAAWVKGVTNAAAAGAGGYTNTLLVK